MITWCTARGLPCLTAKIRASCFRAALSRSSRRKKNGKRPGKCRTWFLWKGSCSKINGVFFTMAERTNTLEWPKHRGGECGASWAELCCSRFHRCLTVGLAELPGQLGFCLNPILQLVAGRATTFQVELICAQSNRFPR